MNASEPWARRFDSMNVTEFLFATGDCARWLIVDVVEVAAGQWEVVGHGTVWPSWDGENGQPLVALPVPTTAWVAPSATTTGEIPHFGEPNVGWLPNASRFVDDKGWLTNVSRWTNGTPFYVNGSWRQGRPWFAIPIKQSSVSTEPYVAHWIDVNRAPFATETNITASCGNGGVLYAEGNATQCTTGLRAHFGASVYASGAVLMTTGGWVGLGGSVCTYEQTSQGPDFGGVDADRRKKYFIFRWFEFCCQHFGNHLVYSTFDI